MSIEILTEGEAKAAEYHVEILEKIKEILIANGSILKAGDRAVLERVFIGIGRALPTLPAIRISGTRHAEQYLTFGNRENTITFTVELEISNEWADNEDNELYIHQLGDRLLEVIRQNDELDSLARQIDSMNVFYNIVPTEAGGFIRVGNVTLSVIKDISV